MTGTARREQLRRPVEAVPDAQTEGVELDETAGTALIAPADAVAHLPALGLDAAGVVAARQGKPLPAPPDAAEGATLRLLDPAGALVAIAESRAGRIAYCRVFLG